MWVFLLHLWTINQWLVKKCFFFNRQFKWTYKSKLFKTMCLFLRFGSPYRALFFLDVDIKEDKCLDDLVQWCQKFISQRMRRVMNIVSTRLLRSGKEFQILVGNYIFYLRFSSHCQSFFITNIWNSWSFFILYKTIQPLRLQHRWRKLEMKWKTFSLLLRLSWWVYSYTKLLHCTLCKNIVDQTY